MRILEKPKDLAARVGVPVSTIRLLIRSKKLDHVFVTPGKRNPRVPEGAWDRYINDSIVRAATACRNDYAVDFAGAKDAVDLRSPCNDLTVTSNDARSGPPKPIDGGNRL